MGQNITITPWGRFIILYQDKDTWLKKLIIAPGQSLSYQYHLNRTEYWVVQDLGVRAIIQGSDIELIKSKIPVAIYPRVRHRLYNPCDHEVAVLEFATGSPDESDIVRLEDNYGRVT